ncbi:MAG: 16S rRNA (cytidine(1402)-2'-O)-methyltransferase [Alphaproteobacteria bacterium]
MALDTLPVMMPANPTEKQGAWLLPARGKKSLKAGLYLVSTPVGNLGDITLRALDTLASCDMVACEDTRVSGRLLQHYGIKKPLLSYNDHNAGRQRGTLLDKIAAGEKIALISDAGTPLVSDPGFKLARECAARGLYVTSIPGASSILPALQLSGFGSDSFCFGGFLPAKSGERKKTLQGWSYIPATLVFFETAPRLVKSLRDIHEVCGNRGVAVVREITKLYEETRKGTAAELIEFYEREGLPKGEMVFVLDRAHDETWDDAAVEKSLRKALKTMGVKEAAHSVATAAGRSTKDLYARALELKS